MSLIDRFPNIKKCTNIPHSNIYNVLCTHKFLVFIQSCFAGEVGQASNELVNFVLEQVATDWFIQSAQGILDNVLNEQL